MWLSRWLTEREAVIFIAGSVIGALVCAAGVMIGARL